MVYSGGAGPDRFAYTMPQERPEYVGKLGRFCTVKVGFSNGNPICVSPFPVAWDIKVAEEEMYRGCEYVRYVR